MPQKHPKGRVERELWDPIPARLGVVNANFTLQGQFVCSYILESKLFHDLQEKKGVSDSLGRLSSSSLSILSNQTTVMSITGRKMKIVYSHNQLSNYKLVNCSYHINMHKLYRYHLE